MRAVLIWAALAVAVGGPVAAAAASPLLAWRDAAYLLAGFAGIVALGLVLVQPLLAGGYLPGLAGVRGRRARGGRIAGSGGRWSGLSSFMSGGFGSPARRT